MTFAGLAVVAASVLAVLSLLPQIIRIHRTGQIAGLSMSWPVVAVVSNAGWTAYVLSQGLYAAVWSTLAMVVAYTVVAVQLVVRRVPWRRAAVLGTGWAALLALAGLSDLVTGWTLLGFVLAVAFLVQVTPAIAAAWRDPAPSGLSPGTWTITLVEVLLWGAYGAANADAALMAFGVAGAAACGAMLVRWSVTRTAVARASGRAAQTA